MKILLVEDSATLRHVMCSYISAAGHEPVVAESGEAALQILEQTPVDMIIMDVEMPGLNGFETTQLIRESLGDHWIPIIFVTGRSEDSSLELGIAAGGDDYLIKPVSQIILNAKIRAMARITEMRRELSDLNDELTILSQRDGLTQLYNRRTFEEKAHEIWKLSQRNKEPFTIVLLDIDFFKLYNDHYGHPAGDNCIREVAQTFSKCLSRAGDIVARYGGEEFVAILPNTPERGAIHICEVIRSTIEQLEVEHRASLVNAFVTVSIGASVVNFTAGTDLEFQIDQADQALYKSKKNGRNRCFVREYNPKSKILVVDDCEDAIASLNEKLRQHCSIISTCDPDDCLALAEEFRPDMILLNMHLKGLNGQKLCARIQSNTIIAKIPLIIISSNKSSELKALTEQVNAVSCLQKPIDSEQLLAKLNQYIYPH